jgi:hypothetical protein
MHVVVEVGLDSHGHAGQGVRMGVPSETSCAESPGLPGLRVAAEKIADVKQHTERRQRVSCLIDNPHLSSQPFQLKSPDVHAVNQHLRRCFW